LTARSAVTSKYSPAVLQKLNEINKKKEDQKTGSVTIEELGQVADEAEATDKVDSGSNQP
jgi:hypothetical protein